MLILMGFILALAFITVTILLGEVITTSNVASVESTDILKGDVFQAVRAVKDQVDFARAQYNSTSDQNNFARLMNNTTLALQAMFASRGIAVDVNWGGAGFLDAAIGTRDDGKIAYCGRANASPFTIRNWLIGKGFSFTDYSYGGDCADRGTDASPTSVGTLFSELCKQPGGGGASDPQRCSTTIGGGSNSALNQTVLIFEFDSLKAEESAGFSGCTKAGTDQLNSRQCQTLQNWTTLGGKFVKTGALGGTGVNQSVIDVLTRSAGTGTWLGYSPASANVNPNTATVPSRIAGVGATAASGIVAPYTAGQLSPAIKNLAVGDEVRFSAGGYVFNHSSVSPADYIFAGVCRDADYDSAARTCTGGVGGSTVLNWSYYAGGTCPVSGGCQVVYLPGLQGEVRNRIGARLVADPDDLRPVFNLTSPGGNCFVNVTVRDWRTQYNVSLLC